MTQPLTGGDQGEGDPNSLLIPHTAFFALLNISEIWSEANLTGATSEFSLIRVGLEHR